MQASTWQVALLRAEVHRVQRRLLDLVDVLHRHRTALATTGMALPTAGRPAHFAASRAVWGLSSADAIAGPSAGLPAAAPAIPEADPPDFLRAYA